MPFDANSIGVERRVCDGGQVPCLVIIALKQASEYLAAFI